MFESSLVRAEMRGLMGLWKGRGVCLLFFNVFRALKEQRMIREGGGGDGGRIRLCVAGSELCHFFWTFRSDIAEANAIAVELPSFCRSR